VTVKELVRQNRSYRRFVQNAAIDRTTLPRLYEYGWLQAQDSSLVMVLAPALSG